MEKIYKLLKLLIWVLAFAVVIVGASLLYNRLSGEVEKPTYFYMFLLQRW